jgi:ATP-dependent RNA helicase DeaD
VFQIRNIERYTNVRIQRAKPPTAVEVEEARANVFLNKLRDTLKSGEYKRQDHLIERLLEEGFSSTDIASALLHHLQVADGVSSNASKPQRESGVEAQRRPPPSQASFAQAEPARPKPIHPPPAVPQRARGAAENGSSAKRLEAKHRPPPGRPVAEPPHLQSEGRTDHDPKTAPPKESRRTPAEQTRLFVNVGQEMGIGPGDMLGAILGETGLPPKTVGAIDVRARHLFVDVASEHVNSIVAKLNRAQLKGRKIKVKVA